MPTVASKMCEIHGSTLSLRITNQPIFTDQKNIEFSSICCVHYVCSQLILKKLSPVFTQFGVSQIGAYPQHYHSWGNMTIHRFFLGYVQYTTCSNKHSLCPEQIPVPTVLRSRYTSMNQHSGQGTPKTTWQRQKSKCGYPQVVLRAPKNNNNNKPYPIQPIVAGGCPKQYQKNNLLLGYHIEPILSGNEPWPAGKYPIQFDRFSQQTKPQVITHRIHVCHIW